MKMDPTDRRTRRTSALRRLLGLALAVCFALGGAVTAWADAISTYTVSVSSGQISIMKSGYVTNTFRTKGNGATVTTGENGNLLVCFYDTNDRYVGVNLGSQEIVNFYGSIGTLKLDSSLDRPVVIGATATVAKLEVEAPVKVSIWGKVNSGSVDAAATLVAAKGSTVSDVYFYNSRSRFYANEGSVVDGTTIRSSEDGGSYRYGSSSASSGSSTSSSSTSTSSGITLKTTALDAIIGDRLEDLENELQYNVEARDRHGRRLDGEFEWVDRGSTRLWETKRYKFRFNPDDSGYDTVTGTIRIIVDDDDEYKEELTLDITPFSTSYDNKRLTYFLSKLEDRVEAHNADGKRISGKVKWSNSSRRVTESGYYKFIFTPNNPEYQTVKDQIWIEVEN